ncbi:replication restart helicase PriA [Fusobacterium sp. PH5-44]|uniref:replication restart helicase PriA n=1 Tax=unclassified Fusobacterium TaxID=2648384 RepID=UPI003D1F2C28
MRYYKIVVDNRDSLFTYLDENEQYEIGERVRISFQNKIVSGTIIAQDMVESPTYKVLPIINRLENEINFSPDFIKLLIWIADYYMCSFSSVFRGIIPKDLKVKYEVYCTLNDRNSIFYDTLDPVVLFFKERIFVGKATLIKNFSKNLVDIMLEKSLLKIVDKKVSLNYNQVKNLDDKNFLLEDDKIKSEEVKKVINYFYSKLKVSKDLLKKKFPDQWKKLINNKIVIEKKELSDRTNDNDENVENKTVRLNHHNVILNEEQEIAKNNILKSNEKYHLIHGITGSGKTEIYIEIIKEGFLEGRGSIFLVPEISLTPQLINRFEKTFGNNIAILHSHLTPKERATEWYSIYTGTKQIVLGVRSAIFAPVKNLKYIILDEEHETTYKQDNNPRYHAKLVAMKRCELTSDTKLILGSATPSIESYYYAENKLFNLEILENRYSDSILPDIDIVDMTKEEDIYFSKKLLREIKSTLLRGEQVILFLNRKGYSTYIQCKDCGHVEECEHCSIKYSYYNRENILKCNYCGTIKGYTGICSICNSKNIVHSGKGIERVEEEVQKYFDVPIISVDSGRAKERGFYEKIYKEFSDGKYKIMIGTQVISKGLHFPNVTLVGVINGDTILNFPDFRAGEKTYQLIIQVAGRAGRGDKKGKVVVQSYQSDNYVFESIKNSNYKKFYDVEISNRELLSYPPFSKTINIGISSKNETVLEKFVETLRKEIDNNDVEIYGPMKSLIYRVKDRYRYNIFIKGNKKSISKYKRFISKKLELFSKEKEIKIAVDIDPINLI